MITQLQIATIVSKSVERTILALSFNKDDEGFLGELELGLCKMVREELRKSGVEVQKKRRAMVTPGKVNMLPQIQNYLPHNYEAYYTPDEYGAYILIEGYDNAGWTLDGYVIPRLSSGLIYAKEIDGNV